MGAIRRAVIDVGTNSIKLLVADVAGGAAIPLFERSEQTRLGQGFYKARHLRRDAIERTARAVAGFAALAAEWDVKSPRLIATSAAREAVNQAELVAAVEKASGLRLDVISGETEADWVFRGVTSDPALAAQPLLILDSGGGSTEFVVGQGGVRRLGRSFDLGAVRLLEQFPPSDPPAPEELSRCRDWLKGFLRDTVRPELEPALKLFAGQKVRLVGTGGAATLLVAMELGLTEFDRARIEGAVLAYPQVVRRTDRLWSLPLRERKKMLRLAPDRADVMLTGAAIYEAVMAGFGFADLAVSTRGLRHGAVLDV